MNHCFAPIFICFPCLFLCTRAKFSENGPNSRYIDILHFFDKTFASTRQLQKHRLKHRASLELRDSMRKEVAKQQRVEEAMREKQEQQKMDISKLNLMINQAEEQMVRLRKRYERAVQHRNDR